MADVEIIRSLTEDESAVLGLMVARVSKHRRLNRLRTDYHDGKKELDRVGFSIPPHMVKGFQTPLGWDEKAVSVPTSRVRPDGFTNRVSGSLMDDLEDITATDFHLKLERQWVRSAMQLGCAFAFVTPGETDEDDPVRTIQPATRATAEVNPRTGEVLAALEIVDGTNVLLYMPGYTLDLVMDQGRWKVTEEIAGIDGMVPCSVYGWDATVEQPFGRSRITRPLMGFTDIGVRTLLRQEVTAEFYSAPQRALMGADEVHFTNAKGERISPLQALIGGIWALPDVWDEDEGKNVRAELKQLSQASMQPHVDMLRSVACMVSSETTIPLGYLGVVHDQPSSADAILASESDMVAMIEAELNGFGAARADFAKKCLAVKNGEWTASMRKDLRRLKARFMDPGTPTLAARADAGQKFVSTFPDGDPEVAMEVYGLPQDQIERQLAYMRRQESAGLLDRVLSSQGDGGTADAEPGAPMSGGSDADQAVQDAQTLKAKFDALGVAVRAGVEPEGAAGRLGLAGIKFTGAVPVSLRVPEKDAAVLEG